MSDTSMHQEKGVSFNKVMAILIALVTTVVALVSFLQSDAGARDDRANRDTKRYSMEAMGREIAGDARVNYDYNSAYQAWYEFDLLATSAQNRGDAVAAARYTELRDRILDLSPLLQEPYFDPATGKPDVARYEADVYIKDLAALQERFASASVIKDAWDYKANTYIIHITLLAVALFLFGLSTTVSARLPQRILGGLGVVLTAFTVGWVVLVFAKPVPTLADKAIEAYAQGVALAHQGDSEQAIVAFGQALEIEPKYANALAQRAATYAARGDYEAAAADYEMARAAGLADGQVAGDLAWAYYTLGRLDDAVKMNQTALKASPDELWIQFDLALAHLAAGQIDAAKTEYARGMDSAARQVADAQAAGKEAPSYLWWGLDDAALSIESLLMAIAADEGTPAQDKIVSPEAVRPVAQEMMCKLKSLAVALEYSGQPPAGELKAQIGEFSFGRPVYDDQSEIQDYNISDTFAFGDDQVAVLFDYEGMQDGQEIVFKVYVDGEEDPSWRIIDPWSLGTAGSAERLLSYAYSNVYTLPAGAYTVELYVDWQLAQRGHFVIAAQES